MEKSQTKHREPAMGRADVLLRFLQLISKDRPEDVDPFLTDLDEDTERRPLVDQIVDRIIAGDKGLYKQYAQARQEVGSRNPYSSAEDPILQNKQEHALGYFLSRWIAFESAVQKTAEKMPNLTPTTLMTSSTDRLLNVLEVPDEMRQQFRSIRALRNLAVHGADRIDESELIEAGRVLENMLQQLHKKSPA